MNADIVSDFLDSFWHEILPSGLWSVGLVYAVCRGPRHPGLSLLVSLACLLLVSNLGGCIVVFILRKDGGLSYEERSLAFSIHGWTWLGLDFTGYALLLIATFAWRRLWSPELPDEDGRD